MDNTFLIAGLGNPGIQYSLTRHNVGFIVADMLLSMMRGGNYLEKFNAEYSKCNYKSFQAVILKPMTFMNLSGQSVSRACSFYKIGINQVIIIHDDIDLDYGIVRVKSGGGTGGHKGIESCKQELGTTDFLRVRVGVGRPVHGDVSNFVLSNFSADEQIILESVVKTAAEAVMHILEFGTTKTMNQFNKRQGDS
ncbi:MAG: aminoacyl-tRNA hydrolase [Deltaproteobacteria bacterium]|nr:aminoacyl-tRNA hydrolase [Deltaproteobacteria bacterium]